MIMVGSQSVAGENVKGEDRKCGDADREVKNVKHADDLRGARWKVSAAIAGRELPRSAYGRGCGGKRIKVRAVFAAAEI
jgi:hypothetical protein